jgi:hypothetical protein
VNGTPLKKFGPFQVFQPRRGTHPHWRVYNTDTGADMGISSVVESANFAARRLAEGQPMETPQERLETAMELYALIYPTKFRYYTSVYLNGHKWVNGGLYDDDLTEYTPEGRAWRRARQEADHRQHRQGLAGYPDESAIETAATLAAYRAGTWPDAADPRTAKQEFLVGTTIGIVPTPTNGIIYLPDEELTKPHTSLGMLTVPDTWATPEWLEDARKATQLILRYGEERDGQSFLETITRWARDLTLRYGGQWLPDEMAGADAPSKA